MAKRSTAKDMEAVKSGLGSRTIVIVGLMGAGKTSVGRRLAEKLKLPFIDADHEIEAAAGKSIAEIFADHGEDYFREGERRVITRILDHGPQVLATGGGAFMNEETRGYIRAKGLSVWLKAELGVLLNRVSKRNNRPLLNQGDPETIMRDLMHQRYPVYATADVTVETSDAHHATTVNEVIRALASFKGLEADDDAG
jgi:shikimate kinase